MNKISISTWKITWVLQCRVFSQILFLKFSFSKLCRWWYEIEPWMIMTASCTPLLYRRVHCLHRRAASFLYRNRRFPSSQTIRGLPHSQGNIRGLPHSQGNILGISHSQGNNWGLPHSQRHNILGISHSQGNLQGIQHNQDNLCAYPMKMKSHEMDQIRKSDLWFEKVGMSADGGKWAFVVPTSQQAAQDLIKVRKGIRKQVPRFF